MRYFARAVVFRVSPILVLGGLAACSSVQTDRVNTATPSTFHTRIVFQPLSREEAERYLEIERHTYKTYTDPMIERKAGLERGREERYREVEKEFPECSRQKHCLQHVSLGDVKKFERYNAVAKEIHAYDAEIFAIDAALADWKTRLDLRCRAIVNRFLVHEMLGLPSSERRVQNVLAYSLESFETRRQLSRKLLRYAPVDSDFEPRVVGDLDFRLYGRPLDEAAVVAAFEVYLTTPPGDFAQPTRFLTTMIVDTWHTDLRFYDQNFLRAWADKFQEPYQRALRQETYCGIYSIAGDTLVSRMEMVRAHRCGAGLRSLNRSADVGRDPDHYFPDGGLLPIAYYAFPRPE